MRLRRPSAFTALVALTVAAAPLAADYLDPHRSHEHKHEVVRSAEVPSTRLADVACEGGYAGPFACDGVDLLSFVPDDEMFTAHTDLLTGGGLSDIWGWTDRVTGDEYVLFGKTNGTAIYRITDPTAPVYVGEIPNDAAQLIWHDIKVDDDYAYIVSESPTHGLKVFDLQRLRGLGAAPVTPYPLIADSTYELEGTAHNIAVTPETDRAYLVGSGQVLGIGGVCTTAEGNPTDAGLHILDIRNPLVPRFAGCYVEDGYIHDAHCAVYEGPDAEHRGREICVTSNEDSVSVVDVTDAANPVRLSRVEYPNTAYAHQGWMSEDQAFYFHGDELDEQDFGLNTRTVVFDLRDLDDAKLSFEKVHETTSIDHNMYTKDGLLFQSNYAAGLRVLDTARVDRGQLPELAFFDTFPQDDAPEFQGTWSNYPYFDSGTIAVTGIGEGLFLLRLQDGVTSKTSPGRRG